MVPLFNHAMRDWPNTLVYNIHYSIIHGIQRAWNRNVCILKVIIIRVLFKLFGEMFHADGAFILVSKEREHIIDISEMSTSLEAKATSECVSYNANSKAHKINNYLTLE